MYLPYYFQTEGEIPQVDTAEKLPNKTTTLYWAIHIPT